MNYIFYHITSASLPWNPFIHFLHTIHIIPPPDIVTGWHILCLIYFLCTIQALIKQEQRSPHSWFLSLHQARLSSPLQRDHQALSLARGPGTLPTSPDSLTPSGLLITSFTTDSIPWLHAICDHPESWQMEHYYILYFKSPSYKRYTLQKFLQLSEVA